MNISDKSFVSKMDPSATTLADTSAAASGDTTAAAAAAAEDTPADGTTMDGGAIGTTTETEGAGADTTTGAGSTTGVVTFAKTTTNINNNAAAEAIRKPYKLQLQEGSNEITTKFVKAIETAAGTVESAATMPDILVTNNHFGIPEYPSDNLLEIWWKSGQPCMAVDGQAVILIICMGAFKGSCYGI